MDTPNCPPKNENWINPTEVEPPLVGDYEVWVTPLPEENFQSYREEGYWNGGSWLFDCDSPTLLHGEVTHYRELPIGRENTEPQKSILASMARTLFCNAYASACESKEISTDYPRAREAANWMDVAPSTPEEAETAAFSLLRKIEKANHRQIECLFNRAADDSEEHLKDPTPEEFGYCLVMEALGSGVKWSDNHPDHKWIIPNVEVMIYEEEGKLHFQTSGL